MLRHKRVQLREMWGRVTAIAIDHTISTEHRKVLSVRVHVPVVQREIQHHCACGNYPFEGRYGYRLRDLVEPPLGEERDHDRPHDPPRTELARQPRRAGAGAY